MEPTQTIIVPLAHSRPAQFDVLVITKINSVTSYCRRRPHTLLFSCEIRSIINIRVRQRNDFVKLQIDRINPDATSGRCCYLSAIISIDTAQTWVKCEK